MGRPRKTEPRSRQFKFCLTEKEFQNIQRRAAALGMRPVNFGRALLFSEKSENTTPEKARETTLQRLVYNQLARIGNNLNQMMRHLHATGAPLPADLEPLLKDIRQLIEKVGS